ncbi:hypothetical protein HYT91_01470, partial [Candidatus Pacearchaeota archaeon]|nr:hypothetical protein [Candidatus Pacearchaeota archaeon]
YSQNSSKYETKIDSICIGSYDSNSNGKRDSVFLKVFGNEGILYYEFLDKDTIEGFEHKREVILGKNKFYNPSKESDLEELIERIMISTKNFPDGTHAFTEDGKLIRYSAE